MRTLMQRSVPIILVYAIIFLATGLFVAYAFRTDETAIRNNQLNLLKRCRDMHGEAVMKYDAAYDVFILTECRVKP